MNWISHLNTATTILLSLDAVSLGVSTLFFSETVRRFVRRRRWGLMHDVIPHIDTIELPPIDSALQRPMRASVTLLHNPFEPKPRKPPEAPPAPAHPEELPRPSFRKSIALQQRISRYERAIARFASDHAQDSGPEVPTMESIRICLLVPHTNPTAGAGFEQALHC
jgi:hypothetical protein